MIIEALKKLVEIASEADLNQFAEYIRLTTDLVGKVALLAMDLKIKELAADKATGKGMSFKGAVKDLEKKKRRAAREMEATKQDMKNSSVSIHKELVKANEILARYKIKEIDIKSKTPCQAAVGIQQTLVDNAEKEVLHDMDLIKSAEKAEIAIDSAKRKNAVTTVFLGENVDTQARRIRVVQDRRMSRGAEHGFAEKQEQFIVRRQPTLSLPEWLEYEPCLAQVNIADKKTGKLEKENLIAYYCKDLNCFFVSSSEYERAMNKGAILATTKEQYNLVFHKDGDRVYATDKSVRGTGAKLLDSPVSALRECGYFVGSKNILSEKTVYEIIRKVSDAGETIPKEISDLMLSKRKLENFERHAILKYAIESRGLSPTQVIDFLEKTKKRQEASLKSRGIKSENIKSYEADIDYVKAEFVNEIEAEQKQEYGRAKERLDHSIASLKNKKEYLEEKLDFVRSSEYKRAVIFDEVEEIDEGEIIDQINDISCKILEITGEDVSENYKPECGEKTAKYQDYDEFER